MIERLRQVFVHAHNLHEQCRFYETLGFKLRFRDGDRWAQFDTGDASFALAGDEEALGAAPGEWLPVFEVPSLEVSMTEARAAGAPWARCATWASTAARCEWQTTPAHRSRSFRRPEDGPGGKAFCLP